MGKSARGKQRSGGLYEAENITVYNVWSSEIYTPIFCHSLRRHVIGLTNSKINACHGLVQITLGIETHEPRLATPQSTIFWSCMMPLPTAVAQTARATRFIRPTLLSVFLETPHCRRISFLKRGTGYARTTNTDAQSQLRSRRLATQSVALTAEGRRKRVLKVENEERLEDLSKESSPLAFHLYSEPNLSKKQHRKGKSTFVEATEESSQTSNVPGGRRRKHVLKVKKEEKLKSRSRESSKKQRTEGKSSIIEALETPPRASSLDPMSDEQTRSCEYDPYDEEAEEEYQVFKQAPNPPLPKHSSNPHKSLGGINGKAAAIAYLRIRGLANCGPKTTFYTILGWVLRHAARELGFEIVPDGFVRISDLVRLFYFFLTRRNLYMVF